MSTFTLAVEFPEELRHLGYTEAEIREQVPVLLVLKRYREGVISSSKGAGILGLSRREFLDLLRQEGIPVYDPTERELDNELTTVQRFGASEP
ncbi:MAG: UPF0175 family protein [Patescibacteria group bacterium]|nr:UPF0175 family protein [Patescibacteria group bacterium]